MQKTDAQLISDCLKGEESAFACILERHLKPTYNFIYRLVGNQEETKDIAQETFVKVWQNLKKYRGSQNFRTWLFTIARNTAIDWLRKKKNFVFSDFEDQEGNNILTDRLADTSALPDELIAKAENQKTLAEALSKILTIYREVLVLRYNDHFSFKEIADVLQKPTNTVKSRHRRALVALKKILISQQNLNRT